jgi:hypothetical protein
MNSTRFSAGLLGGAAIALFALMGPASAVVTVTIDVIQDRTLPAPVSPFPLVYVGTAATDSFVGNTPVTIGNFTATFSGPDTGVYAGTFPVGGPVAASVFGDLDHTSEYFSAGGSGGQVTLTYTTAQTTLNLLWGTVDFDAGRNVLTLGNGFSIDGNTINADVLNVLSAGNDEVYLQITGLSSFTTATFTDSGANAFEFLPGAPSAAVQRGVPEPATWAMMILGFFGLGFMAYRRKQNGPQLRLA